ncbi:MAG: PSD1 domain-containing protein [Acidobacteriota bacterium]|nr:PSD1 domain-containing protein [Acidobacteriota bacterium]
MIGQMRLCAGVLLTISAVCRAAAPVNFERDVRPILSDRCFTCHGPDESTRMVGLRLDTEQGAKAARGPRTPVVPGNPDASEMIRRVSAAEPGRRMPPPYSGRKPLGAEEIAILRAWIEQGAKWQTHWAFVPPRRPDLPPVRNAAWPRNPIDNFILARLEREGLDPSPEADRATLLRRVTFDLSGLPPTPTELDAFLADHSPGAYEKAVDRLLASPRYGERMAVDWLDAARYADTHGYQVDPEREMWPWRDWVIAAFNRNLPYDKFTIEQLAGDLLPNATLEDQIATGFQRNHRINSETGAIAEEFQAENLVDRVSTLGTVWLGLTVGCARCHDHKYDPIPAHDFYSLYAFFNRVDEAGNGGPRDGRGNFQPVVRLPAPELEAQAAARQKEIDGAKRALDAAEAKAAPRQAKWERRALSESPRWHVLTPANLKAAGGVVLTAQPDGSILASGAMPAATFYEFTARTALTGITGFRLELLPDPGLPGGGSGRGPEGKGVVTLFEVKAGGRKIDLSRITADFKSAESELDLVLHPADQLKRGWGVNPQTAAPHYAVIEPARMFGSAHGMDLAIRIGSEYEGAPVGRFRVSVTDAEFPEVMPADVRATLGKSASARSDKERAALRKFFLAHPRECRLAHERLVSLEAAKRAIENKIPTTMVMREMNAPRDTFVLVRGSYDKPGDRVTAAVPAFLPPLPAGAPANRLGLALWLTAPDHPLTARVAVNRYWQAYFGTGIVKTAEDFGSQGEPPSHPELLDWLATEFVRTGWDVKAMQRLIVTSATYRQQSRTSQALRERDPENRLLARGPRLRLTAEMIRDQALAVSGLLNESMGGPPVKPYQPDGLWEQLSAFQGRKLFERSKGPDLWRRSVYTYWKRTVPPPSMTIFDAPTREFCIVRRPVSTTPLQALELLNDEMYMEAARKLAERMMKEGGSTPASRLSYGFRLATERTPSPGESAVLEAGLDRRLAQYRADPEAAAKALSAGEAPRDSSLDAVELAAYTTSASVILNLDETITRQ